MCVPSLPVGDKIADPPVQAIEKQKGTVGTRRASAKPGAPAPSPARPRQAIGEATQVLPKTWLASPGFMQQMLEIAFHRDERYTQQFGKGLQRIGDWPLHNEHGLTVR